MNLLPQPLRPIGRRPRLFVWILGLLVLVAIGTAFGARVVRARRELAAAERECRSDAVAARSRLDAYLARWPEDKEALVLAARAARLSDADADAERYLTTFEAAHEPTAQSRHEWLLLGAQQGDFVSEEQALLRETGPDNPLAPGVLEALARGYFVTHWTQRALALTDQLLQREPDDVFALRTRAAIQASLRRTDLAEEDLRQAVDKAPGCAAAHVELAGILSRVGKTREAISHFELAEQLGPADQALLLGLARALLDDADLEQAGRRLDALLALEPDNAEGLVERGRLALRQGRPAEAEPFLAHAVRVAPWHRAGQQALWVALKKLNRDDEAARCATRLAEMKVEDGVGGKLKLRAEDAPQDTALQLEMWRWCLRNGRPEEGIAHLFQIFRFAPHHRQAHEAVAEFFDRAGQPRRAQVHRALARAS